jgi:transposase InsO family protein
VPPWKMSTMAQRREFVMLFEREGVNRRELCRRFEISPTAAYELLDRWRREGDAGLADRSRRPRHSPNRTASELEAAVVAVRGQHPAWGGRKIRRRLQDGGHAVVPSASTVTAILRRHGLLGAAASAPQPPFQRFEHKAPNRLWQMDYKGHLAMRAGGRCHPLTVLDDHSRYALGLCACADERAETVQAALTGIFRRYGLPERMLMDNGAPWGSDAEHRHTVLTVWLWELGIEVSHGRPYHPQTQGKDERFHRTLVAELVGRHVFADLAEYQHRFDEWRMVYNTQRPHEALALATPITRYQPSPRAFPEKIEPYDYGEGALLRRVEADGWISFRNRPFRVGKAFRRRLVALRPTEEDGCFAVYFCTYKIGIVDFRQEAA